MSILTAPARPVEPGLGYLTDVEFMHLSAAVEAVSEGRACVRRNAAEVLAHADDEPWYASLPTEPDDAEGDPADWPAWTDERWTVSDDRVGRLAAVPTEEDARWWAANSPANARGYDVVARRPMAPISDRDVMVATGCAG